MLPRKALPRAQPQFGQGGWGWIGLQKIQCQLRRQISKEIQHPGVVFLQGARELIECPCLLADDPRVIASEEFDFLRGNRARPQGREVHVISAQKLREHPAIKRITFRGTHTKPIAGSIDGFGIHRVHDDTMIQQTIHHPPVRFLNGRPQLNPCGTPFIELPPPDAQPHRCVGHHPFPHDGARLLSHTHAMLLLAPIYSQIIPCHRSLLGQNLPPRPNDSLALYWSSRGRLPIERCSPFLAWGGRSVLAPLEGVGFVGPRPSKRQGCMIMNNVTTNYSRGLYKATRVGLPSTVTRIANQLPAVGVRKMVGGGWS